jgi:hypothetical protein
MKSKNKVMFCEQWLDLNVHATWTWLKEWTPIRIDQAVRFARQTSISAIWVFAQLHHMKKERSMKSLYALQIQPARLVNKHCVVGYRHLNYLHLVPLPMNRLLTKLKILLLVWIRFSYF